MPTITLNKKVFENLLGKKIPDQELKHNISMLGTDLESISKEEITVEVFPDRPDMLSEQGFARALSAFMGIKTGVRKYHITDSKEKVIIESSVKPVRPYTACCIVKNLALDDEKIREIIQIQEKLHITFCRNREKAAIGIYPFEKIKTPIRYAAKKPEDIRFVPLDSSGEMNGRQILSQHPAGRDYGSLLEGLKKYPVFIDADNQILSMPPIINSHLTGKVSEDTTDIFIECSGFDFKILSELLNILVTSLSDMGGEIYSMDLIYPDKKCKTPDLKTRAMKIDKGYVNKILGLDINEGDIRKYLRRMGIDYSNKKAVIPAYRTDIIHPIDLVEDIAIAYGFDNFREEIPEVATIAEESKFEVFKARIAKILTGLGLLEVNTYHITNKENLNKKMSVDMPCIELDNALTTEYSVLRSWMIPNMMQILSENKHNEYPQKIFEIGTIFKRSKKQSDTGVDEPARLSVVSSHTKADFTEIKQVLDYLFNALDMKYEIRTADHPSFIPGRVGRVSAKGKDIAYIGEMHPAVLENWELEMPVVGLELNVTELFDVINRKN